VFPLLKKLYGLWCYSGVRQTLKKAVFFLEKVYRVASIITGIDAGTRFFDHNLSPGFRVECAVDSAGIGKPEYVFHKVSAATQAAAIPLRLF
jgi:hypothetical protein